MSQGRTLVYRAESEPAILLSHLSAIRELADGEKEALGFLPEVAYRDAIEKRRLIAMCTPRDSRLEVVGFVLFGGVFPNARVQKIVVVLIGEREIAWGEGLTADGEGGEVGEVEGSDRLVGWRDLGCRGI